MAAREKPPDESNVVGRMQLAMGALTVASLAKALGENVHTVKSWKQRNSAPRDALLRVSRDSHRRFEWLAVGPPELPFPRASTQINQQHAGGGLIAGEARPPTWPFVPGAFQATDERARTKIDGALLAKSIAAIDSALADRRLEVPSDSRAKLYGTLYELSCDGGTVNDAVVGLLIDLAISGMRMSK